MTFYYTSTMYVTIWTSIWSDGTLFFFFNLHSLFIFLLYSRTGSRILSKHLKKYVFNHDWTPAGRVRVRVLTWSHLHSSRTHLDRVWVPRCIEYTRRTLNGLCAAALWYLMRNQERLISFSEWLSEDWRTVTLKSVPHRTRFSRHHKEEHWAAPRPERPLETPRRPPETSRRPRALSCYTPPLSSLIWKTGAIVFSGEGKQKEGKKEGRIVRRKKTLPFF